MAEAHTAQPAAAAPAVAEKGPSEEKKGGSILDKILEKGIPLLKKKGPGLLKKLMGKKSTAKNQVEKRETEQKEEGGQQGQGVVVGGGEGEGEGEQNDDDNSSSSSDDNDDQDQGDSNDN